MAVNDTIFTYGPANVTSLLATTLPSHSKVMADNIFTAIPLLAFLADKNRITESGGATLVRPVMYAKNTTATSYASDDILDTTIQDPFTAAQWQWRQYASSISVTGRMEDIQNTGKEAVLNLVDNLLGCAEMSLKDKIDKDLFLTAQAGSAITPLGAIVSNTGTVGDIAGGTNTWWQALTQASGSFAARGLSDMRTVWNQLVQRNPAGPSDIIIGARADFESYEATAVPALRLSDTKMANMGFENFSYKGATWVYDINATAGTLYMLHSRSLELVQHSNRKFVLSGWTKPAAQDLKTAQLFWAGELTTNNRRKLGYLTGITA